MSRGKIILKINTLKINFVALFSDSLIGSLIKLMQFDTTGDLDNEWSTSQYYQAHIQGITLLYKMKNYV